MARDLGDREEADNRVPTFPSLMERPGIDEIAGPRITGCKTAALFIGEGGRLPA